MTEPSEGELQQLVIVEEEGSVNGRNGEVTPPVTPGISKNTQTSPTSPASNKDISSSGGGCSSIRGATSQASSSSRSLSRIATVPCMGSNPSSCTIPHNNSGTRLFFVNEKLKPQRPPPPAPTRLKRDMHVVGVLDRPVHHHCFMSDVTDVRRMESALLKLLEDFHSGNLRAFGKDCSMEQMTGIREQQERLAKLHFELGATQELYAPLSDDGLRQGKQNMAALMSSLEQLSESIEKLHSFSSQPD